MTHDEIGQRAAHELARNEALLRESERIAGICSWSRNLVSGESWVSPAMRRIFAIGPDEAITRELLYGFIHPDDRRQVFEGTAHTFRAGVPFAARIRMIGADGTYLTVAFRCDRFHDPAGEPVGIVGTIQDLTDQLTQADELARAARMEMVGRLAGGLAHDLNNVLTVLIGHAQLLRPVVDAADIDSVDAILEASRRASTLTRQLLEFGRRQMLRPTATDVNETVAQLVALVESAAPPGIELTIDLDDTIPAAHVDAGKLEQVVLNLMLNANDALGDRGTIHVRTGTAEHSGDAELTAGRYVRIDVADDGPGMTAEVLDVAMEPFFTTKPAGAGTGLGLATSHGLVAQSGGRLTIESAPGRGTIATVLLQSASESRGQDERDVGRGSDERVRASILLAEDDDQLRPMLARALAARGHRVLTAIDGLDAMEIAAQAAEHIDLLLTDVSMPRRDGFELATALTAVYPELAVVFMSGYTDNPSVIEGVAAHNLDFVAKPFRLEDLLDTVETALVRCR